MRIALYLLYVCACSAPTGRSVAPSQRSENVAPAPGIPAVVPDAAVPDAPVPVDAAVPTVSLPPPPARIQLSTEPVAGVTVPRRCLSADRHVGSMVQTVLQANEDRYHAELAKLGLSSIEPARHRDPEQRDPRALPQIVSLTIDGVTGDYLVGYWTDWFTGGSAPRFVVDANRRLYAVRAADSPETRRVELTLCGCEYIRCPVTCATYSCAKEREAREAAWPVAFGPLEAGTTFGGDLAVLNGVTVSTPYARGACKRKQPCPKRG